MHLKMAVLQQRPQDRQYEANTGIVLARMEQAAAAHANILLLPEAFLTGYALPMGNEEALPGAPGENVYLQRICEAAARLRLGVVATAIAKGREKPATPPGWWTKTAA